jgi:hypothetical protein
MALNDYVLQMQIGEFWNETNQKNQFIVTELLKLKQVYEKIKSHALYAKASDAEKLQVETAMDLIDKFANNFYNS